jgi:flagellar motor protein MotB
MALTDNSGRQTGVHSSSTTIQFLSLFLLLLAIFISLVSISTPENIKSKAVMDSLNSTFASVRQPRTELTVFTSRAGRFIGADEFQDRIDGLFAAALGVEQVEIVAPGRSMRVVMDADALFHADKIEIREAQIPMVDRIIASLNGRPPGLRFDMEFVIGAEVTGAGELPIGQTLQMARAGSLAREMLARGAPPDTVSIGLRGGAPNKITMWFFVRATDEVDLFYKTLAGTLAKPAAQDGINIPPAAAPAPEAGPNGQ